MIFIFRFKYLLNVILYFLFINVCNMDFKLERQSEKEIKVCIRLWVFVEFYLIIVNDFKMWFE